MTITRSRLSILALAGLIMVIGIVFSAHSSCDITDESFGRIQYGMTKAKVEMILGGSAGDYRSGPSADSLPTASIGRLQMWDGPGTWPPENVPIYEWKGDTAVIMVAFDTDERVMFLQYHRAYPVKQTALANLCWRVERQWRKWFPKR